MGISTRSKQWLFDLITTLGPIKVLHPILINPPRALTKTFLLKEELEPI